jgi:hypothetical protein
MKTCAAPAASKVKFNMKIHMPAGKVLKAKIAAMTATKARVAATPKIKFSMKIHLPAADGKALKAKIAAMTATKDTKTIAAKKANKAVAKDTKKQTAMDPKKDSANGGKGGCNDEEGVLDMMIENLDLVKRDPSNTNVSSKDVSKIEKKLSNLFIDQV